MLRDYNNILVTLSVAGEGQTAYGYQRCERLVHDLLDSKSDTTFVTQGDKVMLLRHNQVRLKLLCLVKIQLCKARECQCKYEHMNQVVLLSFLQLTPEITYL